MAQDFTPHSHIPYGSDGSGFYSDNTIGCYNVVRAATPTVISALENIPFQHGSDAFTICDYGTADGGTSMFLIHDIIKWVKDHYGKDQEVLVVYEDQPVNDFKSIFLRLQGLIPGPPSYCTMFDGVFVAATGTGFYSRCLPKNAVHLGFSATAFHWLSQRPGPLDDAIHHVCSKNDEQKKVFKDQAEQDWELLLLNRAAELKPGGQIVITCLCVDNDGNYLGRSPRLKESMYDQMTDCWREMLSEGKITEEEFCRTQFNNYYRTVDEFKKPFLAGSAVYNSGLRLVSIETKLVRCPYHEKWVKTGIAGDTEAARAHAKWFIPTTRTWSNHTFLSSLSESRQEHQREKLVDEMFAKYEDRVAAAPGDHGMDYTHAYIHIKKI